MCAFDLFVPPVDEYNDEYQTGGPFAVLFTYWHLFFIDSVPFGVPFGVLFGVPYGVPLGAFFVLLLSVINGVPFGVPLGVIFDSLHFI